MTIYDTKGLAQLIGPGKKPGRKGLVPNWAIAKLEKRLQQPRGFKSYLEIQQWLESKCGIKVKELLVISVDLTRIISQALKTKLAYF